MAKILSELLEKEVTRKEFLQFAGAAIIALLGMDNFLKIVTHFAHGTPSAADRNERHGFGSSRFGT